MAHISVEGNSCRPIVLLNNDAFLWHSDKSSIDYRVTDTVNSVTANRYVPKAHLIMQNHAIEATGLDIQQFHQWHVKKHNKHGSMVLSMANG